MTSSFRRSRPWLTLKHCLEHWREFKRNPGYRKSDEKARNDFLQFRDQRGGAGLKCNVLPGTGAQKTALIIGQAYLPFAPLEALVIKALQMAGYRTVIGGGSLPYEFLRYSWLAGNRTAYTFTDLQSEPDDAWVDSRMSGLKTLHDWLALEYQGVHVGRFTIASALRQFRVGKLPFEQSETQEVLRRILRASVRNAMAAVRLFDMIDPQCVLVMDRGYAGHGEVFDLAINRGIDTMTWNLGYKSNRLLFKRYNRGNEREHPLSPSADTWQRLRTMPWRREDGRKVREELFQCYETQDWFSMVGTQFDKKILSQQAARAKLGLAPDKKVAVIFPHILWDGSFFWGEDLFEDYTQWFIETMRAACANPRLEWVVKLHPAHLVKAKQNKDAGRPSELDVIEKNIGALPGHIKLVHPDTDLSTYSLFEMADYAVTVRGTVGIESALFGIPVVTAGTGRYDRRGFTLDSTTREEYLHKLATLESFAALSPEQVEIVERYAYGAFFCRPLRLSCASLEFERDAIATPKFTVRCATRQQWFDAPDMRLLSSWIADGKTEDMFMPPQE
jgi:hypothetical protein